MHNPLERCTISFIVRIWAEHLKQQPPSWRGMLEICEQGEEVAFGSLEALMALIQENTKDQLIMEDQQ